jgi:hypothetical protein
VWTMCKCVLGEEMLDCGNRARFPCFSGTQSRRGGESECLDTTELGQVWEA